MNTYDIISNAFREARKHIYCAAVHILRGRIIIASMRRA